MITETERVVFPEHFGFCEGVKAADDLLRDVMTIAREFGIDTVYGYHGIVHNDTVIREHEANGVRFVDEMSEIPDDSVVVTSAHGVGPEVVHALAEKGSTVFDAVCPLVLHTHRAVNRARMENEKVIYICKGKPGVDEKLHDEVVGVLGHLNYTIKEGDLIEEPLERSFVGLHEALSDELLSNNDEKYRIVTQTTLNAEEALRYRQEITDYIRDRQPNATVGVSVAGDVCRAVTNRQNSVVYLVGLKPERIVVATDRKSKNGMGYVALANSLIDASDQSTEVYNVATAEEAEELGKIDGLTGLTASASTPDATTFAIAKVLGAENLPNVNRKSFKSRDDRVYMLMSKLGAHVQRVKRRLV